MHDLIGSKLIGCRFTNHSVSKTKLKTSIYILKPKFFIRKRHKFLLTSSIKWELCRMFKVLLIGCNEFWMINMLLGVELIVVQLISTFPVSIDDDNWMDNGFIHYSKTSFGLDWFFLVDRLATDVLWQQVKRKKINQRTDELCMVNFM